ncbi:hypothetical protein B0H11DRAFT_2248276 [Mycena galericulata]|nr:hypothetical protein B0H11DRAFT_2248276 [Mycena galericulata]
MLLFLFPHLPSLPTAVPAHLTHGPLATHLNSAQYGVTDLMDHLRVAFGTTLPHVSPALSASHPLTPPNPHRCLPTPTVPTRVMLPEWADNDDTNQGLLPSAMLATGVVPEVMDWGQCCMHVVLSFMIPPEFYHVVGFVGVTFCYALGAEPFSEWADDDENGENGNQASTVGTLRTFPTIPELSLTVPYDPFKVDIYQLGLTIQKLIQTYRALRDFRPVATAMLNPNSWERPSPTESLVQLNSIAAGLSQRTLSASMWEKGGVFNHLTRKLVGGYYPSQPYI